LLGPWAGKIGSRAFRGALTGVAEGRALDSRLCAQRFRALLRACRWPLQSWRRARCEWRRSSRHRSIAAGKSRRLRRRHLGLAIVVTPGGRPRLLVMTPMWTLCTGVNRSASLMGSAGNARLPVARLPTSAWSCLSRRTCSCAMEPESSTITRTSTSWMGGWIVPLAGSSSPPSASLPVSGLLSSISSVVLSSGVSADSCSASSGSGMSATGAPSFFAVCAFSSVSYGFVCILCFVVRARDEQCCGAEQASVFHGCLRRGR